MAKRKKYSVYFVYTNGFHETEYGKEVEESSFAEALKQWKKMCELAKQGKYLGFYDDIYDDKQTQAEEIELDFFGYEGMGQVRLEEENEGLLCLFDMDTGTTLYKRK